MGKKVREYKSGDFIFAKVKGYPAWPARVQRMNGKKYFVYFYGTGETANLPPNMIFDYVENKEKFLNKTVKRKDFNDGVRQIEHDFANNVPLEQVIGAVPEEPAETSLNDTANETLANDTVNDTTVADTTAADETTVDDTVNTTQNDTGIEDSDEGTLVIDEGKKGKKPKASEAAKTPAKPTPVKVIKEPKTPRGKAKKEDAKDKEDEEKKEEELVSRSGRKIRPKRYMDEQTEENATLPATKKRRAASPVAEKEKEKEKSESKEVKAGEKNIKHYNTVTQSEIEYLKQPFTQEDPEKENLLIAYLPNGQYVGIKLFQSRPASFKNEASRLQWDKQAASNAIALKTQLEKGHIAPQSVVALLEMELNLTDEEKAALDKEREVEEKKCRVQFLKTEMKLIELDAKIKTCLSLEKADTELCLSLLDELMELNVRPLMLLKHPTCLETVKRMRAYVGNTPSWDLSESAALVFSKQAHRIRTQANTLYRHMKELFTTPEGLSFWEFFSERVLQFKKATAKLNADELLEMVHEPLEMSVPTSHTMKAAIDAANEEETNVNATANANDEDEGQKKKSAPVKSKKASNNNTPSKPPLKRQSSRKQQQEEKEKEDAKKDKEDNTQEQSNDTETSEIEKVDKPTEKTKEKPEKSKEKPEKTPDKEKQDKSQKSTEKDTNKDENKDSNEENENNKESETSTEPMEVDSNIEDQEKAIEKNDSEVKDKTSKEDSKSPKQSGEDKSQEKEEKEQSDKDGDNKKEKQDIDEPRAKRSRESKKTEPPPPRSPAKRKSKS